MKIELKGLRREYGDFRAVNDVSLVVADGEFLTLLGPSGSGKTTLLRLIAGLDVQDSGRVFFNDLDVSRTHVRDRKIGFVFQNFALFEHMTVFDNVAFGLRTFFQLRARERRVKQEVYELLQRVGLDGLQHRYPRELSGGQRQRVAVARALAPKPRVLLMDEPFGALDVLVRREVRSWVRRIQRDLGVTAVLVTHDQQEAAELSDRIAVMHAGSIQQVGTYEELLRSPNDDFVRRFLAYDSPPASSEAAVIQSATKFSSSSSGTSVSGITRRRTPMPASCTESGEPLISGCQVASPRPSASRR